MRVAGVKTHSSSSKGIERFIVHLSLADTGPSRGSFRIEKKSKLRAVRSVLGRAPDRVGRTSVLKPSVVWLRVDDKGEKS